ETLAVELNLNGISVPGSKIYSFTGSGGSIIEPAISHTMLLKVTTISNLQIVNASTATITHGVFVTNGVTSSINIIQLA
ncbi:hypothetical protein, partial [Bacillus toyonensis]|uniref:hypothetical protein n=1 Tax=Bacillus toyonensis TaxID=155322 RepID=UPI002FFE96BB